MAIVGFCKLCAAPAHVEYYGVIYCYECGKRVIKKARESASAGQPAAGAVDRADNEGGASGEPA